MWKEIVDHFKALSLNPWWYFGICLMSVGPCLRPHPVFSPWWYIPVSVTALFFMSLGLKITKRE